MNEAVAAGDAGAPVSQARYDEIADTFGPVLARLAAGYEADADRRQDLLQDIHVRLWQSLARFDGRCSLRTWVYRVAHNVAADHVARERRWRRTDGPEIDAETMPDAEASPEQKVEQRLTVERLLDLVRQLRRTDRQVMLLYLEGESAATIAEVTGLSAGAVATRIHRAKSLLGERIERGDRS